MTEEFLSIGDNICLYCEETEGYVYNCQSSSVHNELYIHQRQDKRKPKEVANPHALTFQVCIQNRYKLNKKYRKLTESTNGYTDNLETQALLSQAKRAADAENDDNEAEQRRQHGKRVRYGQIIQLRHLFTGKYVQVSTSQTSQKDKNSMMVHLREYNSKHAQFRILPRYKVKSEGEVVQVDDQIVFESVKSPGQYLHTSIPWQLDYFTNGSELNLAVNQTAFTIVKYSRPSPDQNMFLKGGSFIRMFHKDLEAYLVAEGLFDENTTEQVHMRIRPVDQSQPRTLYPSTSAITYWQVEAEESILSGDVIQWEQQVRFRHATLRQYLCIKMDGSRLQVTLTTDATDPDTVFRLHPVIRETDEIQYESYARIEHVLSGSWLHALKDDTYTRSPATTDGPTGSMSKLTWDGASLRKVTASSERLYRDAFTIQCVTSEHAQCVNYVAGMVPFLINLLFSRQNGKFFSANSSYKVVTALKELSGFLSVNGQPVKERQKLLRNFRIIDLLMKLLRIPLTGSSDVPQVAVVMRAAYDVLLATMLGNSRKNKMYIARYMSLFDSHLMAKEVGLQVTQTLVELIRDNRKVIDRVSKKFFDFIVNLLQENKNYRYLDLLSVMCVCDNVAIPNNQTAIAELWLQNSKSLCLTSRGQEIGRENDVIFVSIDQGATWIPMKDFVNEKSPTFSKENYLFFEHQLDLFGKICHGRNRRSAELITEKASYLTWDVAFLCIQAQSLPDQLRAKFCDLIVGLFIDVGTNYSILDTMNLTFIYEEIRESAIGESTSQSYSRSFTVLRDWLAKFLDDNRVMIACQVDHNVLIGKVLNLIYCLVKFGYYGDARDVKKLQIPLLSLLDGRTDIPFPQEIKQKGKSHSKAALKLIDQYRTKDRFQQSKETKAVVDAKFQALLVLDLLLNYQLHVRLESFVAKFKTTEQSLLNRTSKGSITGLLSEEFDAHADTSKEKKEHKRMLKILEDMFDRSAYFDTFKITSVLIDLSNYTYDKIVIGSMSLLNKFYSSKTDMFKWAVRVQLLTAADTCDVYKAVRELLPVLRQFSKARLNDEQAMTVGNILDTFIGFCDSSTEIHNSMNQNILLTNDVLKVITDILSQEIDEQLMDQYSATKAVMAKSLKLLKVLVRNNETVQTEVMKSLDQLLRVRVVEADLAISLRELFVGNQENCIKISPRQIEQIVAMAADQRERAPEVLELLSSIVKVENAHVTLRRNQTYVVKYLMQYGERFSELFDENAENRLKRLQGGFGEQGKAYAVNMVKLLASCAEGDNRFIDSLCQNVFPMSQILEIINHPVVDQTSKAPFLRYITWVYMKASTKTEMGATDLAHHQMMWKYLNSLVPLTERVTEYTLNNVNNIAEFLQKDPPKREKTDSNGFSPSCSVHFLLQYVMPFLQAFFTKVYVTEEADLYPDEVRTIDALSRALVRFCKRVRASVKDPSYLKNMIWSVTSLLQHASTGRSDLDKFMKDFAKFDWLSDTSTQTLQDRAENGIGCLVKSGFQTFALNSTLLTLCHQGNQHHVMENATNHSFKTFAVNCSLLYGGHNTAESQLAKYNTKKELKHGAKREYTTFGGDEALPLGREFQDHVHCLQSLNAKTTDRKYEKMLIVLEQLSISATKGDQSDIDARDQTELVVRSLQLLRAVIHNEERKLPANWQENPQEHKKQLFIIEDIQNIFNEHGAVVKVLPLLGRSDEQIVREVLAFLSAMLFNANRNVQESILRYFQTNRDEDFFPAIRNKMHLSTIAIKERRALASQNEARLKEVSAHAQAFKSAMTIGRRALQELTILENAMNNKKLKRDVKLDLAKLQSNSATNSKRKKKKGKEKPSKGEHQMNSTENSTQGDHVTTSDDVELLDLPGHGGDMLQEGYENLSFDDKCDTKTEAESSDNGQIELVLRVLARMCDGQFYGLQGYLREQPDNMKSFDLIAETAQFLEVVYSDINCDSLNIVIQIFRTLNELASGNQGNRSVIVNNKVIDYINFLLRTGSYPGCAPEKVLELRQVIGNLLLSLIEENSPEALSLAMEVKDTLDKEVVFHFMTYCYEMCQAEKKSFGEMFASLSSTGGSGVRMSGYLSSAKSLAQVGGKWLKGFIKGNVNKIQEIFRSVGFTYFFIISRMWDIDSNVIQELKIIPEEDRAVQFYRKGSMSVELLKDNHLHKVTFRVKNRGVLRKEVREKLKWNVDRSSPSNKIRDLMDWYKDIVKDIYYQRRVLSVPLARAFTNYWLLWNTLCIMLSLAINVLMLVTWQAKASDREAGPNLPEGIHDPVPVINNNTISQEVYDITFYSMAVTHNVFSFILLISYFLSNHPQLPNFHSLRRLVRRRDDNKLDTKEHKSKLDVHLFGFKTFYYLLFFAMSILGTFFHGYFFAFHLLNIVNNNPLLSGVIRAITTNGGSLLWVGLLGLVVLYIFSLLAFAFFRSTLAVKDEMFCSTLYECTLTILRYGLIGDIFDYMRHHDNEKTFENFGYSTIYLLLVFVLITTIGLNIILGIILDTFSELRNTKWQAALDMQSTCFICSRNSYDFEHHGGGFEHHVKNEHNLHAYLYFFIHLDDTKPNDYTALDFYVHRLLSEERYDFFPLNRALSLRHADEDNAESKLDDLMRQVNLLVQKQREEEAEKKRHEERLRQQEWEEKHRLGMRTYDQTDGHRREYVNPYYQVTKL